MKIEVRHLLSQCLLLLLMVCVSSFAMAQTVTGTITDAKTGEALIGANVAAKGTDTGVSTDVDGKYSINTNGATVLIVSYIGYAEQEVAIDGRSQINIALSEGVQTDEIVVIGYGTSKKSDLTGAIVSIKSKDFNKGVVTAPDQLIQGKVAGVQIMSNSGQPGSGTTIRIRGNSSVRTGNSPLFVIDGVQQDGGSARPGANITGLGNSADANPLNFINPNDIESMEVLKDASATAIYGSRGANGVIIVTTKKGKNGAPKINFNTSFGSSSILKRYDVLTGDEYRAALTDYGLTGGDDGASVDAMDAILQTGLSQNYNFSIGGGSELGNYRISLGYLDQEGIIKESGLKKYTSNIAGQFNFFDKRLSIAYNLMAGHVSEGLAPVSTNAGFTGSLVGQALQWNPTSPLYNADGSYNVLLGSTTVNPAAMLGALDDKAETTTIFASIAPSYKLTDNLTYRFLYSVKHGVGDRRIEIADWINLDATVGRGLGYIAANTLNTQQYTHTLSYANDLTDDVSFNGVVGYEYQTKKHSGFDFSGQDFLTNAVSYTDQIQSTSQGSRNMTSFRIPTSELQSYFGRAFFNIKDKYLLTATVRADGSSKFGANNKYGVFPSFSAAWNLTKEGFLPESIYTMKLRAGWGQTGNQEFPEGAAQARYGFGNTGTLALENVANPDLKWETSSTFNIGLDFSILEGKVYGSLDYFHKTTSDLLFNFATIQPAPASRYWVNLDGEVINSGVELQLGTFLVSNENLEWTLGGNVSFLNNVLQNYTGPNVLTGGLFGQGVSGATVQRLENGQPLNTYYVRDYTGLNDAGLSQYVDDGNSLFYLGDPNADVLLGITTNINAGDFSFGLNFNGAFGHMIYNNTANTVLPIGNLGSRNVDANLIGGSVKEDISNAITSSDRYLENGNFLKLSNATVGYTIGDIEGIKNIRVSLTGQNLLVFTNYSGFDPEVNTVNDIDGVPSFGLEYTPYPSARTILFNIGFSF